MRKFGLIGKKLGHSFSARYFTKKFRDENLYDHSYELFEIPVIEDVALVFKQQVSGLNVTIPYKQAIIPYLDELEASARKVGAVNVVKIDGGKKTGYNSDYTGFKISLLDWLNGNLPPKALVLGTGGASRAVTAVLKDFGIEYELVSRNPAEGLMTYSELHPKLLGEYPLIINTTPLGTYPATGEAPDIPYSGLTSDHYLYDLVYNPEVTLFMKHGIARRAKVKNGLEMLHIQAERSWEIWNEK